MLHCCFQNHLLLLPHAVDAVDAVVLAVWAVLAVAVVEAQVRRIQDCKTQLDRGSLPPSHCPTRCESLQKELSDAADIVT